MSNMEFWPAFNKGKISELSLQMHQILHKKIEEVVEYVWMKLGEAEKRAFTRGWMKDKSLLGRVVVK